MIKKIHISPWMTIGISLLLMGIVAFLGAVNYNRDKERMGNLLKEKGAALIRSFEAGTRTGMMGMMGETGVFANEVHLQVLLEETAGQPDIAYISIVDEAGVIQAHNERRVIGKRFLSEQALAGLSPSEKPKWRIVDTKSGERFFEVYKVFLPVMEHFGHVHKPWKSGVTSRRLLDPDTRPFIFIGMHIGHFEAAMSEDLRHNIVMAAIIFALGLAGVVSLFWAQSYTRSQKLLHDTRKFASEVVTNLPVGILVMDTGFRILYTNDVACELLGHPKKKVTGGNAKAFLPGSIRDLHSRIKQDRPVVEKEITLNPEPGRKFPVSVSATNIIGEDGRYIGFMFVLKDLTEIRLLEIKTQQIEKLAAVGNLAAGIAHEVRNPLSSIKGYVTYFGTLFDPGSENRKAAELMAEEVDRVNRVITELLEFARPSDLKFKEVRPDELIEHSVRVISHEAESAGVGIQVDLMPGLPGIQADPDRLMQVMLNLYINAVQAMEGGGQLKISAKTAGEDVVIKLTDTGCGISPADIKQIFDPYFTTKNNGTGLGLAIAHKIIDNHNGSIRVESGENEGTRVSISLPIDQEKEDFT